MRYFDIDSAGREANVGPEALRELCDAIRHEFPRDEMMYELHVLRACMAIRKGDIDIEELLRAEIPAPAEG